MKIIHVFILLVIIYGFLTIEQSFALIKGIDHLDITHVINGDCDETLVDEGYYLPDNKGEFRIFWYHFNNNSTKDLYIQQWKTVIMSGDQYALFNLTVNEKRQNNNLISAGEDLFVLNRLYLANQNYIVKGNQRVRVLTTAQEHGDININNYNYKTYFKEGTWSFLKEGIQDDQFSEILPNTYEFTQPNMKIINKPNSPTIKKNVFDIFFKVGLLFDEDDNLSTTGDNQIKITCYGMQIRRCGDGIVNSKLEEEYGIASLKFEEECDWAKDPTNCNIYCKIIDKKCNNDLICDPNTEGCDCPDCASICGKSPPIPCPDLDNDGICDKDDACTELPEDIDGIEEEDGCPEIKDPIITPKIEPTNCNQCPCQYADYASQLWKGDIVRAILFDKNGKQLYKYSVPYPIDRDIGQKK